MCFTVKWKKISVKLQRYPSCRLALILAFSRSHPVNGGLASSALIH